MKILCGLGSSLTKKAKKLFGSNSEATRPSTPPSVIRSMGKSEGWANLIAFLESMNQAANLTGLVPVKTIAEGFAKCIGIYEEVAESRKEYEALRVQLEADFKELNQYFSASPIITTSIASICGSIQKELDHVKAQQQRPTTQRITEAERDADDVLECYRRIHDHLQRLSRNANISTWTIVDQLATDHRLEKLAPSLWACYNSEKATELKRGPCTEGTRVNVLARMSEWATDRNSGGVYWMNGMAGTGKTTIAYSLCRQLAAKENSLLCASFFCSRSLPECRSVGRIIPSIAYQIAQCSPPFRYALAKATRKNPDAHTQLPDLQFESLIEQPFSDDKVKDAFPTNMTVVIDALDECEDTRSTKQILEVILTKSKGLPIKFVVSSRPEAGIRYQMEKNGTWVDSRVILHELDTGEVQMDIKTYLRAELSPMNPSDSDIDKLTERAGVLFIYAATAVRYVGYEDFGMNPRARLDIVLGISERPGKTQTTEIDELYEAILKAAIDNKQLEQGEQDDIKLIISTVVCAQAPLSVGALNRLLRLGELGRVSAALHPLWSVLHVTGPEMTVTTLHASFPDYLTDPARSGELSWHCNAAAHHALLAQRCFECIRDTRPQFNICRLESSYLHDSEVEELSSRVQRFISVELRYACLYWPSHLIASSTGTISTLPMLLEQFLTKHLLLWMEVMNLTQKIAATPDNLLTASRWAIQHTTVHELLDLTQDAWRFAYTVVSSPVCQSTPHIYISMLPFLPSSSHIRKHYHAQMKGMIGVNGTALDRRKPLLARWELDGGSCITCSPDGTLIATVSLYDHRICLIDALSGQFVRHLSHKDIKGVSCMAFSHDSTRVASGSATSIWVWDVNSGQSLFGPLEADQGSIVSIIFLHDGSRIVSGSADGTICIRDVHTGKPASSPLVGHTKEVGSLAISSDDSKIVSGSSDTTIRIWDVRTGRILLDPFTGHTTAVEALAISPNDQFIVSFSGNTTVQIWDSGTGQILLEPFSFKEYVSSVAISLDSAFILVGFGDGAIRIWDATSGQNVCSLSGHTKAVMAFGFSSDGTRIISCSSNEIDSWLCLHDAQSIVAGKDNLLSRAMRILSIDVSPDGKHIVSGSDDKAVYVWDAITGQMMHSPLTGHTSSAHFVRYSPDSQRILSCSYDKALFQWDAQTGNRIQTSNLVTDTSTRDTSFNYFASAAYSPDGSRIVTLSYRSDLCIWSSGSGDLVVGPVHTKVAGVLAEFSSDGTNLITGGGDGAVRKWDTHSGQLLFHTRSLGPFDLGYVRDFAFSPDHSYSVVIYSGSMGASYMSLRKIIQKEKEPLYFDTFHDSCVRFSHDGTHIVSGSIDGFLVIRNAQTGKPILGLLEGHTDRVNSVAYSPDGSYVASGSEDGTVRTWDTDMQPKSSSFEEWVLSKDGWVRDRQFRRRLIWVPPDFRSLLQSPRNKMVLSLNGYVQLNFDGALIGDKWGDCGLDD